MRRTSRPSAWSARDASLALWATARAARAREHGPSVGALVEMWGQALVEGVQKASEQERRRRCLRKASWLKQSYTSLLKTSKDSKAGKAF